MTVDSASIAVQLRSRLADLEKRLGAIKRDVSKEHSNDWAEQAQERENDEVLDVIGTETHDAIKSIKAALRRIDEGSYGECENCGELIAASRLDVRPEATLCIKCAD
jgi:RNA polymerase-binding transcription factor DksA